MKQHWSKNYNYRFSFIAVILMLLLVNCTSYDITIDVKTYGAIGDGITVNTKIIQKAIDDCHAKGGGTVQIDDGTYVTGTLLLKDSVRLHITENTILLGSSNPLDYTSIDTFIDATGQERGNCLIGAKNAKNISISGKGTIDGNGTAFLSDNLKKTRKKLELTENQTKKFGTNRPFLLRFVNSSQIKIKQIKLRQPAAWTCHFYQSNDIEIDQISIYSHAHRNNDGIDLDSSHDVIISDCTIDTGDDAICFKTTSPKPTYNVQINNCRLKSDWGTIKFGTESMGDMYDISIKNCSITDTKGGGIKILSVDGANIYNIEIDSIKMSKTDMPIFIRLGERLRTYRNAKPQQVGSIDAISIKNIEATTRKPSNSRINPPNGMLITGTPNHSIGNISLENITIQLPGGGLLADTDIEVPEAETKYPEFSFFGVLPAYGLYARHINELNLINTTFELIEKDAREALILEDVSTLNTN